MSTQKALLITGAGSGLGLECALFLAERNYRVFGAVLNDAEGAALLDAATRRRAAVTPLRMDVTNPQDIRECLDRVLAECSGIDGLIHFAGLGLRGFFEDLSIDEIRRVYEVNVFGIMSLTQAVLPHMRARRAGRVIVTSSAGGRMGAMSISGYASSKFAVEGFAECLSLEVRPFNIHVSLLEPGLIKTPHFTVNRNQAARATNPDSPYYAWFQRHEELVDGILARNHFTAEDVARQVYKILAARRPRLRYVVGRNAKLVLNLRRYIPGELFERVYWGIARRVVTSPPKRSK
ncbi:MAG TPA: SDR family oxidoreductase [Bryobacteraceae bacterium]|nr:SDR family oxidoreductase [Bryobacteraceae bacterium]